MNFRYRIMIKTPYYLLVYSPVTFLGGSLPGLGMVDLILSRRGRLGGGAASCLFFSAGDEERCEDSYKLLKFSF